MTTVQVLIIDAFIDADGRQTGGNRASVSELLNAAQRVDVPLTYDLLRHHRRGDAKVTYGTHWL